MDNAGAPLTRTLGDSTFPALYSCVQPPEEGAETPGPDFLQAVGDLGRFLTDSTSQHQKKTNTKESSDTVCQVSTWVGCN